MTELRSNPVGPPMPAGAPIDNPWLVVPVDASDASMRTLDRAIVIATRQAHTIVLAGTLSDRTDGPALDPLVVENLLQAGELGIFVRAIEPTAVPGEEDEAEERVARTLWRVLLPCATRVRAAGLQVQLRALRRSAIALELYTLLEDAPAGSALVLGDPGSLNDPLRALTAATLRPPCTLYLTGIDTREPRRLGQLLAQRVRRLWQPRVR